MAGIRRFITYIYAYESGKKAGNAGFAKIEVRGGECRIAAHLNGAPQQTGICSAYIFMEKDGAMLAFLIGEAEMRNGSGTFGTVVKAERIGDSEYAFSQMDGLVFADAAGQVCMTRWTEGAPLRVTAENIRLWQPPQLAAKENERTADGAPAREAYAQSFAQNADTESRRTDNGGAGQREEAVRAAEKTQPFARTDAVYATEMARAAVRNVFPGDSMADIWERMRGGYPFFSLSGDGGADCLRIELKDLRELPKKHWYLGNNSFLLHGFFNYRYLVFGQLEEEQWFLGVPGVYQQQERVMAAIFGFPGFLPEDGENAAKNGRESEPFNRFGYWYHLL